MDRDTLTRRLMKGRGISEGRMKAALGKAWAVIEAAARSPEEAEEARGHLYEGLTLEGVSFLDGDDPQRIEDAVLANYPRTPLLEVHLRRALMAFSDELERVGEGPAYGTGGRAEAWAFSARCRPPLFVDPERNINRVAKRFAKGLHVVIVRGLGRSSFLAALRRHLLHAHGAQALIPPVFPAARDDLKGLIRPYLDEATLPGSLTQVLDQLQYGEDLLGVFGRAGTAQPVALLLDDAHVQSRAALLGLPLLLEPSGQRDALLVLGAPEDPKHDGPLTAIIEDARARQILAEITLPEWGPALVEALLEAAHGEAKPAWREALLEAHPEARPADRFRCAHQWLEADEIPSEAFDPLPLLPKSKEAQATLSIAAFEGWRFHALALGRLLGHDEDHIEDLLFDDEFELGGEVVGGCEAIISPKGREWGQAHEGLTPAYRFTDPRVMLLLRARLKPEDRRNVARGLRDHLLKLYGPQHAWQVADTLWALDLQTGNPPMVHQALLGQTDARRVEAAFKRFAPILAVQAPYHLALARLYGAGMEMGSMGALSGKVSLADQGFQAAAAAASRLERPGLGGEAMARLGEMRLAMASPGPARDALDLADSLLQRGDHKTSAARVRILRSEVALLEGDVMSAVKQLRVGLADLRALGDARHTGLALARLGRVLYELGHVDEAKATLEEAIKEADKARDPRPSAAARMSAAFVEAELEELDAAFPKLQAAAELFQRARMPAHIVEVAAAGLQRRHGQPKGAEQRLRTMAKVFKDASAASQWADAWFEVAECLAAQDKWEEALRALREVEEIRARARDRFSLIRVYERQGEAHAGMGAAADGIKALAMARAMAARLGLAGHQGRLDASLALMKGALDDIPELTAEGVMAEAEARVEEMEATWAAPVPAPQSEAIH